MHEPIPDLIVDEDRKILRHDLLAELCRAHGMDIEEAVRRLQARETLVDLFGLSSAPKRIRDLNRANRAVEILASAHAAYDGDYEDPVLTNRLPLLLIEATLLDRP